MATRHVATCEDCAWSRKYSEAWRAQYGATRHAGRCPGPARQHRRSCRTCGWASVADTARRADASKRRHSCEWQLAIKARRERGELKRAAMDRTSRPCHHKIANHQHGTHAKYVLDRCRCDDCRAANLDYETSRARAQAYGRWDNYVDAEPVRQHVRSLMDQGMGLPRLVKEYGLSGGQLNKLLYGHPRDDGSRRPPSRRVAKATAERILAIELSLADGAVVAGAETSRRLQALVACGWTQRNLAHRLGVNDSNFGLLIHGHRDVTVKTARAVHAIYVDLVDAAPPRRTPQERASVTKALTQASKMGWPPPLRIGGKAHVGTALPATGEAS